MTVFWITAGALCLLTLWALWRPLSSHSALKMESIQQRNIAIASERALEIDSAFETGEISEQERDQARQDLEMALADELATSHELKDQFSQAPLPGNLIALLLIPALALGVYSYTNTYQPDAVDLRQQAAEGNAPSLDEIIKKLEEAVEANPEDQQGLYLLAQSYSQLGRYGEAAQRFKQLIETTDPDPELFVAYVDNNVMANGQVFSEEMAQWLDRALELNPHHISGLWLRGMAALQLGHPEEALRHWLTLQPLMSESPEASQELNKMINGVRQELGDARTQEIENQLLESPSPVDPVETTVTARLTVRVTLAPELQTEVSDSDTVFIFARAKSGPPMPLAASRQSVSSLPITVTLDDSMAMMPQMSLSKFEEVVVGARVSKSGQATPQAGDFESQLVESANHSSDVIELLISNRRE